MLTFLITSGVIASLIAFYILVGREWLKEQPWTGKFFSWIEPIEITLWRKSETILWSRLLMIAGIIPLFLQEVEKFNIPALQDLLPEMYRGFWTLSFTVIGIVNEWLRRSTTKPLALVEIPETAPTKELEAVKSAEIATKEAVATVEIAAVEKKAEIK